MHCVPSARVIVCDVNLRPYLSNTIRTASCRCGSEPYHSQQTFVSSSRRSHASEESKSRRLSLKRPNASSSNTTGIVSLSNGRLHPRTWSGPAIFLNWGEEAKEDAAPLLITLRRRNFPSSSCAERARFLPPVTSLNSQSV